MRKIDWNSLMTVHRSRYLLTLESKMEENAIDIVTLAAELSAAWLSDANIRVHSLARLDRSLVRSAEVAPKGDR